MNSTVQKLSVTVFSAAVAIALVACGQAPSDNAGNSTVADATRAPEQAPPPKAPKRSYPSGVFEHAAAAGLNTDGVCALDHINKEPVGTIPYAVGDELLFAGWFLPPRGVAASQPLLVLDNGTSQFAHEFKTGGKREDVARRNNRPEVTDSGYNVRVALAGLPAGEYAVWLAQEGDGGFRCNTKKSITVNP